MASGCGDVLSLEDLKTAKLHHIFEAEVITGHQGGVASGADIDYATNPVTGQTQKTMPAILRDIGYEPASFDFTTGGTLASTDRNKAVLWPLSSGGDGAYYYWEGALPKVIPAASAPSSTGGIATGAWKPVGDVGLRKDLNSPQGASLVKFGGITVQEALGVNVKGFPFNAKGDGVTDDTAAIQAAIDFASVEFQDSRTVFFPKGVYAISSGLVLNPLCNSLTLEGEGEHSRIKNMTNNSFDMISWSSLPSGSVATSRQRIASLCFDGNAAVGGGSCIDTAFVSMLTLENITILEIGTDAIGVYLNGHSDNITYNHEIDVRNLRVISTTGFAGLACSHTSSDSMIDGYWCEGNFGLKYCLYLADGCASNQFSRMHISNAKYNVLFVGNVVLGASFTNINFDNTSGSSEAGDVVRMFKATKCRFSDCRFGPAVIGKASLGFEDNARNNTFDNCSFWGGNGTATPFNESDNTCDFNIVNNAVIIDNYASAPSVRGLNSRFRINAGASVNFSGNYAQLTAGQTVYMGAGYGSTAGPSHAYVIGGSVGYLRKVAVQLSTAASAGSINVRIYKNSEMIDSFSISGASTYISAKMVNISISENDFINLEIVSAAGTPTTDIRSIIVVD